MNDIIAPFQLKSNRVVQFYIKQNSVLVDADSVEVQLGADFHISDLSEDQEGYQARLDLLVNLKGTSDAGDCLFEVKLDMMGVFEGRRKQLEKEKFIEMLKINGISTLMQLSRAYVTAATALSGFGSPLNFPMVNVFELVKRKESDRTAGE